MIPDFSKFPPFETRDPSKIEDTAEFIEIKVLGENVVRRVLSAVTSRGAPCPRCDAHGVYGKPGEQVCTACGALS